MHEVGLAEWLTSVWDEDEAAFDVACEAEAERCRNDGMPDYTAAEVKEYWQTLPGWAGWKFKLARIAADRKILALHARVVRFQFAGQIAYGCDACKDGPIQDADYWPCETVLALVERHADRPGYQERWAVQ